MRAKRTSSTTVEQVREFTVLIEFGADGYILASVPALKSCYTQAKTLFALYPRLEEIIGLCIEEQAIS